MPRRLTFAEMIAKGRPIAIDGGLATQLESQGHDLNQELWSASVLRDDPDAITAAHRAYLDAGAKILITSGYQASRKSFAQAGISAEAADELILLSVSLAVDARDAYLMDHPDTDCVPLIAASVGPYGAALHDGSEYRGDYAIDRAGLRAFHENRIRLLDNSNADLLACETIPSAIEAAVLADLLADCDKPSWVCFSCKDSEHISDGTLLLDAVAQFRDNDKVLAVGINCTAPQFITPLIRRLKEALPEKAIVIYPNSGETYHVEDNSWSGTVTAADWQESAQQWAAAGASIIGGCCRTGPDQIRAISALF